MWSNEEIKYINKYINDIKEFYYKYSYLPYLTTLIDNPKLENALKFEKRYLLEHFQLSPSIFWEFSRITQGIQMAEFQYVIDRLKENAIVPDNIIEFSELPNQHIIQQAIFKIYSLNKPIFMIVPIAFFTDMHKWGMRYDSPHQIVWEGGHAFFKIFDQKINIIWSNKFVKLNEIIIGNKRESKWYYKPDEKTGERLTVKFESDNLDTILILKAVFKYHTPQPREISIIKFPSEFCEFPPKK